MSGPGGIALNKTPWEQEQARYAFVDEMAALRPAIRGAGNRVRFDYWLNTFRYLRAVGRMGCMRGRLDAIIKEMDAEKDPVSRKRLARDEALPVRLAMARQWEKLITLQLAVTDTPGAMGTVANLEQHNYRRLHVVDAHDAKLAAALGEALPDEATPTRQYLGRPRIIVPTVRSRLDAGEKLTLKVVVLDNAPAHAAALHFRAMGKGEYKQVPLTHVARGVYKVTLPPARDTAIEYYVTARTAKGDSLVWPATAPELSQTIVIIPRPVGKD